MDPNPGENHASPVKFSVKAESNQAAVLFETDDIDTFNAVFASEETDTSMSEYSIRRATAKAVVLDREFGFSGGCAKTNSKRTMLIRRGR